jgi:hypothetical protein
MPYEIEHDPLIAFEDDGGELHQPYLAFNQGFDAAEQGTPASLNPYDESTREHAWWAMGYVEFNEQMEGGDER